ncbi:uncharacterized protein [Oscarella lobularis]|uniref:uncharacterized protein isoform X2 n=1 Tax=Oscarella lobularis TaxID=121494 RepID=UPI003314401D
MADARSKNRSNALTFDQLSELVRVARDNEMKGKERNRRIMSEFDRARQRIAAKNVSLDILNAAKKNYVEACLDPMYDDWKAAVCSQRRQWEEKRRVDAKAALVASVGNFQPMTSSTRHKPVFPNFSLSQIKATLTTPEDEKEEKEEEEEDEGENFLPLTVEQLGSRGPIKTTVELENNDDDDNDDDDDDESVSIALPQANSQQEEQSGSCTESNEDEEQVEEKVVLTDRQRDAEEQSVVTSEEDDDKEVVASLISPEHADENEADNAEEEVVVNRTYDEEKSLNSPEEIEKNDVPVVDNVVSFSTEEEVVVIRKFDEEKSLSFPEQAEENDVDNVVSFSGGEVSVSSTMLSTESEAPVNHHPTPLNIVNLKKLMTAIENDVHMGVETEDLYQDEDCSIGMKKRVQQALEINGSLEHFSASSLSMVALDELRRLCAGNERIPPLIPSAMLRQGTPLDRIQFRDELDPSWVPCWDLMSTHLGVLFGQSILSVDVAVGVFLPVLLSPSQLERADRKQKASASDILKCAFQSIIGSSSKECSSAVSTADVPKQNDSLDIEEAAAAISPTALSPQPIIDTRSEKTASRLSFLLESDSESELMEKVLSRQPKKHHQSDDVIEIDEHLSENNDEDDDFDFYD